MAIRFVMEDGGAADVRDTGRIMMEDMSMSGVELEVEVEEASAVANARRVLALQTSQPEVHANCLARSLASKRPRPATLRPHWSTPTHRPAIYPSHLGAWPVASHLRPICHRVPTMSSHWQH